MLVCTKRLVTRKSRVKYLALTAQELLERLKFSIYVKLKGRGYRVKHVYIRNIPEKVLSLEIVMLNIKTIANTVQKFCEQGSSSPQEL